MALVVAAVVVVLLLLLLLLDVLFSGPAPMPLGARAPAPAPARVQLIWNDDTPWFFSANRTQKIIILRPIILPVIQ